MSAITIPLNLSGASEPLKVLLAHILYIYFSAVQIGLVLCSLMTV